MMRIPMVGGDFQKMYLFNYGLLSELNIPVTVS